MKVIITTLNGKKKKIKLRGEKEILKFALSEFDVNEDGDSPLTRPTKEEEAVAYLTGYCMGSFPAIKVKDSNHQ